MTIPTATYRIQFRDGMTFDRAVEVTPYLQKLGISHLYASPIFTAATGSTHGYDVTNANEIDPTIGGREGFERLAAALKAHNIGLILDIVPNHMAASMENAWWKDVVELGSSSRYADYFDIDWTRHLTLPVLSKSFEEVLNAGEISTQLDPATGKLAFHYEGTSYPLNPSSYSGREDEILGTVDKQVLSELHERQSYRLMCWREASANLSYRRFFEVTGLAGLRVEERHVFDDAHRLILELVRSGAVDGLRVDHVDGLADPKAYLDRLRSKVGADCYITVEKILGPDERLPQDWPISGTTGYEFAAAMSDVFVNNEKITQLKIGYGEVTAGQFDTTAELRNAKLLMVDKNFAGEFGSLLELAVKALSTETRMMALERESLRSALRELVVSFPVYRTYGTPEGMPAESVSVLSDVVADIKRGPYPVDAQRLDDLHHMLEAGIGSLASELRTRFQQLTGPLMAKSVEDTLFYRQNIAMALNEVGAEPLPRTYSLDEFHRRMVERFEIQPDGLSATSTHDTKRGEDARARLYSLTEAPELWSAAVKRWRSMNAHFRQSLNDELVPEPAVEWMLYQALAGVWPQELNEKDEEALAALEKRFTRYVEKALREAKLKTNWGYENEAYEAAVIAYARKLLFVENESFLSDFKITLQPFMEAGASNSLSQAIVKLTAPGVPDIYQGSEGFDLSLVDPDNRRAPDFAALNKALSAGDVQAGEWENSQSPYRKLHIVKSLLYLRKQDSDLFRTGRYLPLTVEGAAARHFLAYARITDDDALLVIVPRLTMNSILAGQSLREDAWLNLTHELYHRNYIDVMTGSAQTVGMRTSIAEILGRKNFAVLKASG